MLNARSSNYPRVAVSFICVLVATLVLSCGSSQRLSTRARPSDPPSLQVRTVAGLTPGGCNLMQSVNPPANMPMTGIEPSTHDCLRLAEAGFSLSRAKASVPHPCSGPTCNVVIVSLTVSQETKLNSFLKAVSGMRIAWVAFGSIQSSDELLYLGTQDVPPLPQWLVRVYDSSTANRLAESLNGI